MQETVEDIITGVLFVLPSLVLLIALTWIYLVFGQLPIVAGILYGVKPDVTAIVLHPAPLTGVSAAVVGVVLNLALFFCWHMMWHQPFDGPFQWLAATIGLVAFFCLWRLKGESFRCLAVVRPSD